MYKILIADDHPLFREAITSVIKARFEGCETFEADDLEEAKEIVEQQDDLDLILLDLNMPGMCGLSGLVSLRNDSPTIPVVIISAEDDKQIILQTITCGAVGFITKSSPREMMGEALEQILGGNVYLPSDIIRTNSSQSSRERNQNEHAAISGDLLSSLTRRQLMVLECMAKGDANKQIAYNLHISETTVKSHVSSILRKLNVHNRIQAVLGVGNIDFSQYLRR